MAHKKEETKPTHSVGDQCSVSGADWHDGLVEILKLNDDGYTAKCFVPKTQRVIKKIALEFLIPTGVADGRQEVQSLPQTGG